jgi:hypothetical protein
VSTRFAVDDEGMMIKARLAYLEAFGNEGPYPFGVSDADLAAALNAAVAAGRPIPADFNWYTDLPKGAVT